MFDEVNILLTTAASIAFLHTILGPDHYLVFVAMGKARNWSLRKTLGVTFFCGLGHVLSSVIIGGVGIFLGSNLDKLVAIETGRGNLAAWALLAVGAVYMAWGLRRAGRGHTHTHLHRHGDTEHSHEHNHHEHHAHVHTHKSSLSVAPWALFIVFVLGPCEALIPLFMYPAAQQSGGLVISVAVVFGVVTLLTMLVMVTLAVKGLEKIKIPRLEQYAHAIAGASIVICAGAISLAGL